VHTIGAGGEGHVDASVHDDARGALSVARATEHLGPDPVDPRQQRRALEAAVADLDPVHAGAHRGGYGARGSGVEHQGQDRSRSLRGQNVASPSRGLDAEA
jgi:hypothetical protein